MSRLLAEYQCEQFNSLEARIKAREVFGFDWRGCIWFPMFQFDLLDWSLRPGINEIFMALPSAASDWAVAFWFATSNPKLRGQIPANIWATNLPDVLEAAKLTPKSQKQLCMEA